MADPVSLGTSRHKLYHLYQIFISSLSNLYQIFIKSWSSFQFGHWRPESFLQVLVMLLCMPVATFLAKTWDDAADILHCLPVPFRCSRGIYCQQLSPRYEWPSVVGGAFDWICQNRWHHICPFWGHQHPMVLIPSSRSLCRKLEPFLVPHTVQLSIADATQHVIKKNKRECAPAPAHTHIHTKPVRLVSPSFRSVKNMDSWSFVWILSLVPRW